ncbi:glycosyltransferase family 39 protein [Saccharothrix australiensis]|uniref:4-amino-4-deoxy-L-arabinose transferase-like glycosyltransferase n=1 Tax=Saccharothrix australiensis TaxID=2072 RepID=A0A495VZ42_9PSEU|nr:glycosyltransferase family 39 protein [Saccharothrix australiensis]RKT54479.1 4-amino-4-deoxy-L-arabinose transferase-like glycosyltransferase [Saccharothrix australiensis]
MVAEARTAAESAATIDEPVARDLPAFARQPVLVVAGAVVAALLATAGRYGFAGDELYFLRAGRSLDWSYADQPPLVPLVARLVDLLFGPNLVALRVFPALLTGVGVVLAALLAREFGGARRAQLVAAGAFACSPIVLVHGHWLATATLDIVSWALICLLLVRWVRTRRDVLLLWAGVTTAVALQNKFLVVFLVVVLLVSIAVTGPREVLGRPLLWVGAAIAVVATVPALLWQASHGWPQLAMGPVLSAEIDAVEGGRAMFLPFVLGSAGPLLMFPAMYGTWRLLRAEWLRPYRFLGWTVVGLLAVFLITNGRQYYVAGVFPVVWAVAAVELDRADSARWWRFAFGKVGFAFSALAAVFLALPVLPVTSVATGPQAFLLSSVETIGNPELVDAVERAYRALPAARQEEAVVVADTYGPASAVEVLGRERGLPHAYSPHRGYWYFGAPPDSARTVLFVGADENYLRQYFGSVRRVGEVDNGVGVVNFSQGMAIWLCEDVKQPWSRLWPTMHHLA